MAYEGLRRLFRSMQAAELERKRKEKVKKIELSARTAAVTQRRRLRGLGRRSTLLTSGRGVTGEAPVVRKSLLGQ